MIPDYIKEAFRAGIPQLDWHGGVNPCAGGGFVIRLVGWNPTRDGALSTEYFVSDLWMLEKNAISAESIAAWIEDVQEEYAKHH